MIREFNKNDMSAIVEIWLKATIKAHRFIEEGYWYSKIGAMKDIYIPASKTYIYEDEITRVISGFISLVDNKVEALFVSPSLQKRGIGKALLDFVKQQRTDIILNVFLKNKDAIHFYKKQGFKCIKENVDIATGEWEVIMAYNKCEQMER